MKRIYNFLGHVIQFMCIAYVLQIVSCSGYKVKEIPPGDVLEKELRAPPEMFRDESSREMKEPEEVKKTGKKK